MKQPMRRKTVPKPEKQAQQEPAWRKWARRAFFLLFFLGYLYILTKVGHQPFHQPVKARLAANGAQGETDGVAKP